MDILAPCYSFDEPDLVRAAGLYPYFQVLSGCEGPTVRIDGREVIMMGSNNYLGLTHHPAVLQAAREALERYGTGCTGSRFLNGNLDLHLELERELAEFVGKEAALVFSSGFLANAGVLGVLGAHPGALLLSDQENHASIIEGMRLSRGEVKVYRSLDDLESFLAADRDAARALVVTDGVFSMTGRVADLSRLAQLKGRFGFRLYVDDAHGFGVLGPQGRGTAHEQGVQDDVDLLFATFSKSLASLGGFVAGPRRVIDYLQHKARTLIFSAALPPASTASALAALQVVRTDGELFERLWRNVEFFAEGLRRIGFTTLGSRTPILPIFIGSESLAFVICRDLLDRGIFTTPVVYPAVPHGQALIRTSTTPAHTRQQLETVLESLQAIRTSYPIPEIDPERPPRAEGYDLSFALERLERRTAAAEADREIA